MVENKDKQIAIVQEETILQRFIRILWQQCLRPLATGMVFGCGSMLGVVFVRYYVMEPLVERGYLNIRYQGFQPPQ